MTDRPAIETFSLEGETFRAWEARVAGVKTRWFVMHHDPETAEGHEHYLLGSPESFGAAKALAAAHVDALRETGNCAENIAVRWSLNGVVHRAHAAYPKTACGLPIPGSVNEFRVAGRVRSDDRVFTCQRCANGWHWRPY